ncbi:MAG: choice-of-anchor J domain-containing protein, partial [Bacteroidetes bacterium]|nr:choice-of-anchor J domain-containing protein [Bacteroidota bacterium]
MKNFILIFILVISTSCFAQSNFSEGWEGDWNQNWTISNGTWQVGVPINGPGSAHGGQNCAAIVLNGNYPPNANTRLISSAITIPGSTQNPRLRFWQWFSFSIGDSARVEIKTAGDVNWIPVSGRYTYTSSNTWSCPLIDLSSYAGQNVQIAFHFYSNSDGYV